MSLAHSLRARLLRFAREATLRLAIRLVLLAGECGSLAKVG